MRRVSEREGKQGEREGGSERGRKTHQWWNDHVEVLQMPVLGVTENRRKHIYQQLQRKEVEQLVLKVLISK